MHREPGSSIHTFERGCADDQGAVSRNVVRDGVEGAQRSLEAWKRNQQPRILRTATALVP